MYTWKSSFNNLIRLFLKIRITYKLEKDKGSLNMNFLSLDKIN